MHQLHRKFKFNYKVKKTVLADADRTIEALKGFEKTFYIHILQLKKNS